MNSDPPPPLTFEELFNDQSFMKSCEEEILKSTVLSTESSSPHPGIQESWANDLITNHGQTSEFAEATNNVEGSAEYVLGLSQNQLQDGLLNDAFNFPCSEEEVDAHTGENFTLPPFQFLNADNATLVPFISASNSSVASDLILLETDGISTEGSTPPEAVPTTSSRVVKSKGAAANRKRYSSESSSVSSKSFAQDSKNGKGSSQKKVKLYEKEDKSDPLVKRADYAHTYRIKKKEEKKGLQQELASTKEALVKAEEQVAELQEKTAKQAEYIISLTADNKEKDEECINLRNALTAEKNKNSLNSHQTVELFKGIASVVKTSCPLDAEKVQVLVSEKLAAKKGTTIGDEQIQEICAVDNLRKQSCTFTFDIDDKKNRLIARKD